MTITYETGGGLYVNITNKCSNRCEFCIRKLGPGAYGSDSLWLEREPRVEEVVADILSHDLTKYRELVFCGYGEPTERLHDMLEICRRVKASSDISIRLNTNGQTPLLYPGEDVATPFKGLVNTVSVSLNAAGAAEYQRVCHSKFGEAAYGALLEFAASLVPYVDRVLLSVVRGSIPDGEIEKCRDIAKRAGVELRVREMIK